jgi:ATP synthase mitochondrial F1 complex assembly factor 2
MNHIFHQRVPALRIAGCQVYRNYCGRPPTQNAAKVSDFAHRGTHLAGRNRFYKFVGVKPVDPPWKDTKSSVLTVDSPISAGVDDTQSATGVQTLLATDVVKKERLMPRKPGSNGANESVNWYGVTLDGRIVKTPLGQTLAVPSEILAWAIAAEWDAQEKSLRPAQMPLMTLVCTALDQTTAAPEVAQANSLTYLPTDTICYWADPVEDRLLHRKQKEAWDSIHNHCETFFGERAAVAMGANEGLLLSRVQGRKSIGLPPS